MHINAYLIHPPSWYWPVSCHNDTVAIDTVLSPNCFLYNFGHHWQELVGNKRASDSAELMCHTSGHIVTKPTTWTNRHALLIKW